MTLVLQVPCHLPDALDERVRELLVDFNIRSRFSAVSPCGA